MATTSPEAGLQRRRSSSMAGTAAFIAVDWGTTNFRASLVSHSGSALGSVSNDGGLLKIAAATEQGKEGSAAFESHLESSVGEWKRAHPQAIILMAGMVGSNKGWVDAPYARCPADINALMTGVQQVTNTKGWDIRVVPGLCVRDEFSDVMRGEETQILGMMAMQEALPDGFVCLPGSHSKWVTIKAGVIETFKTFMTGELFSLLSEHSILRFSVTVPDGTATDHDMELTAAFDEGVKAGYAQPDEVTHLTFMVRTRQIFDRVSEADNRLFLSGLLIGAEIGAAKITPECVTGAVTIIGSSQLGRRYKKALELIGVEATILSSEEASNRGLLSVYEKSLMTEEVI